jgi:hypothetical protein
MYDRKARRVKRMRQTDLEWLRFYVLAPSLQLWGATMTDPRLNEIEIKISFQDALIDVPNHRQMSSPYRRGSERLAATYQPDSQGCAGPSVWLSSSNTSALGGLFAMRPRHSCSKL